jgi:magnesium-transporting ATPase (P-type)
MQSCKMAVFPRNMPPGAAERPRSPGAAKAERRLASYGPNVLSGEKRKGFVPEFLGRFRDPLTIQILVICSVSYAMGDLRAGTSCSA